MEDTPRFRAGFLFEDFFVDAAGSADGEAAARGERDGGLDAGLALAARLANPMLASSGNASQGRQDAVINSSSSGFSVPA
jgi:hypothetical protein